jgi:sugar phosphate isomerase/epimerase
VRAISLQDFYWQKERDAWKMRKCPLGEGMVDWQKFFSLVSAAHFTGPLSLHMEYETTDPLAALAKDLEFAKKHIAQGWPSSGT